MPSVLFVCARNPPLNGPVPPRAFDAMGPRVIHAHTPAIPVPTDRTQPPAAAKSAGKQAGILIREPAEIPRYRDLGFTHIAVDSDLSILRKVWQQTVSDVAR